MIRMMLRGGAWFHDVMLMLALIYVAVNHREQGIGRRLLAGLV